MKKKMKFDMRQKEKDVVCKDTRMSIKCKCGLIGCNSVIDWCSRKKRVRFSCQIMKQIDRLVQYTYRIMAINVLLGSKSQVL